MALKETGNDIVATINDYPDSQYNRLFPSTITQLSPLHKVMVNIVQINPVENGGDVYKPKTGGLALTKIACLKLMTAANTIMEESKPILPKACARCMQVAKQTKIAPQCGPCPSKDDVAYQVSILVPEPSGGHRRYIATKEINKNLFVAKNGGENKAPVEHMDAQCESKALLRALRAGLGIKGSYTAAELKKPFAVAVVVLNTTDPDLKAALIQRYAAGENALFGSTSPAITAGSDNSRLAIAEGVDMDTSEIVERGNAIASTTVVDDDDLPPDLAGFASGGDDEPEPIPCQGDDCGRIIEPYQDKNGTERSVDELLEISQKLAGLNLCGDCISKEVTAKQKAGGK